VFNIPVATLQVIWRCHTVMDIAQHRCDVVVAFHLMQTDCPLTAPEDHWDFYLIIFFMVCLFLNINFDILSLHK